MTLEQLRIFLAVAEDLHFTRAARRLGLTQPAISGAIAALESHHAVKLFHRVGRTVSLTEAGKLLRQDAQAILDRVAECEQRLADLSGLRSGSLTLMASQTAGTYWLPPRLHAFAERYPGLTLHLTIGNTQQVTAAVVAGEVDLGVVEGVVDDPHLSRRPRATDHLVVVVGPGHRWFGRRSLSAEDLRQGAWITREPGSGTRALFEQAFEQLGVCVRDLTVTLTLPNGEAIRHALSSGHGAAVISDLVCRTDVEAGRLHAIRLPIPPRPFTIIRHLERYEGAAVRAFMEMTGI